MIYDEEPLTGERDFPLLAIFESLTVSQLRHLGITKCRHVGAVTGAILCALIAAKVLKWVSYSRNPNHYMVERPYLGEEYTLRKVFYAIELLLSLGLIEELRRKPHQYGWQSRFRATARLLELTAGWSEFRVLHTELLRLKNAQKRPIALPESSEVDRMRSQLVSHNEALERLDIGVFNDGFDIQALADNVNNRIVVPRFRRLSRVYNISLLYGGRLYGGFWQNLPRTVRAKLIINGYPVQELDYPSFHPTLLYAAFGLSLTTDAYSIPGVDREIAKRAFQMLLNCRSKRQAVSALAKELVDRGVAVDRSSGEKQARVILRKLEVLHRPVEMAFYQIVGRRLHRIDSDLLLRVMDRCLDLGICGLPVHDSLIVPGPDAGRVQAIMGEELNVTLERLSDDGFQGLLNPETLASSHA